jgi:MSHA biogenesis protein MshK
MSMPFASSAEDLPDPTRPPAAVDAADSGAAVGGALVLQSVILGKGRRPAAIISGQRVELNGMVGDARLIRLSETEAVLAGPAGRQVLKLTPEATKRQPTADLQPRRAPAPSRGTPSP